jgi:hypothetical protein
VDSEGRNIRHDLNVGGKEPSFASMKFIAGRYGPEQEDACNNGAKSVKTHANLHHASSNNIMLYTCP